MTAFGAPLTPMDLDTKPLGPGAALVKVARAGVCHSDLHIHDGYFDLGGGQKRPVAIEFPAILGHEIEGEVAQLGPGAAGPAIGTRVAVYPWLGCGACGTCKSGDQQLCLAVPRHALGVAQWGGMAEYVHVPYADALIPIGDLTPGFGALAMCSGLTAYSALKKIGAPAQQDPILLIGMGGVGLMALSIAKARFKNPIIVADIDAAKREAALARGAVDAVDPSSGDAVTRVLKTYGGAPAAVDFVVAPQTFEFRTAILRRAGTYVVVGLFGGAASLQLATVALRPISIVGSYVGRLDEARELVALLRTGAIAPPPMQERPLAEADKAMNDLRAGAVLGRIVLKP